MTAAIDTFLARRTLVAVALIDAGITDLEAGDPWLWSPSGRVTGAA
jgi:hypothetical protein